MTNTTNLAVAAAIGLALLGPAPAAASQLVVNAGFETGDFSGWTRFGAGGFTGVDGANPFSGDFAAYFSPNQPGGISQVVNTLAGKTYALSFRFAHEAGGATPINALAINFGGALLNGFSGFAGQPYTGVSYVVAGGGPTLLSLTFQDARPTRFFLDDVSLSGPVPEPVTWLMLVGGFVMTGIAIRQRRRGVPTVAA